MKDKPNKNQGFNLITVIIIVLVTSFVVAITTGVIVTNNYKSKNGELYKKVVQDDDLSEFIEVYSSLLDDYYEDVNKSELIEAAISGMLNYLDDSYTTYMDKGQTNSLAEKLEGSYKGIGIIISERQIVSVLDDSPAQKAGILAGDILESINGVDISSKTTLEVTELIKSTPDGESLEIGVSRDNASLKFTLSLKELYIPAIDYDVLEGTKTGYIYISVFSKTIASQFKKALEKLEEQNIENLIIDVRNNTGGFLAGSQDIASLFLEKSKIIYSLENKDGVTTYYDETEEKRNYNIVVLINSESASASEILAAALKDSYGAKLVGNKSYGKGKVQQTVNLKNQSLAKYTSARWLRPNGECVDNVGIVPDYSIDLEYERNDEGKVVVVKDTQLVKALDVLN